MLIGLSEKLWLPGITLKIKAWQLGAEGICFQRASRFDNSKRFRSSKVAGGGGVYDCPGFIVLEIGLR
jgi:hypothetical protein